MGRRAFRGGPAKVAVVSSGLYGTNQRVVGGGLLRDGTFHDPVDEADRLRAEIAGAIEACASCGGR